MRKVAVTTGINPSGRTLVLLKFSDRKTLAAFKAMVRALQDRQALPANAFIVTSDLSGRGGEILLVLPPSQETGLILRNLRATAATRLQLDIAGAPMSWADYEVYNQIAERHAG